MIGSRFALGCFGIGPGFGIGFGLDFGPEIYPMVFEMQKFDFKAAIGSRLVAIIMAYRSSVLAGTEVG
jgi:hypothetical protein